jgi:hypothetical protein
MMRFPKRPSPAMVVACIALVMALGGTGYAALNIPASSVGTAQLKPNAVTSAKVKNGALTKGDLAPNAVSAAAPLRSGEVVTGAIGLDLNTETAGSDFSVTQNLPARPPRPLLDETVDIDGLDEVGNRCTGTFEEPTAPRGILCMYPIDNGNATAHRGESVGDTGEGFLVNWTAPAAGDTFFNAAWAYRAP